MGILIPLLIALIIIVIAVILGRRKKSRKQSDAPETPAKSKGALSTPSRAKPQTPARTVVENKGVEDAKGTPETPLLSEPKTPSDTTRSPETSPKISEPPNYPDSSKKNSRQYYEHAGKPLNGPIIRDILNALEPWQGSLPVSVVFEVITEYHLRKGGKSTQLKDFHTNTYDILREMEDEGRAERYRDGGRDYWKLLP